jgi:DNA-binding MarR family transcriptional regulator
MSMQKRSSKRPGFYLRRVGAAALGAQLRRLSDRIDREANQIYAGLGFKFEQRWFGLLNQLVRRGPLSVAELALALGVSHVAVSQTRAALVAQDFIAMRNDAKDARRRTLVLTARGRRLTRQLRRTWQRLDRVARELDREAGGVVAVLAKLEHALDRQSLLERVQ